MTVEDTDETRPLLADSNADAGDKSARALAAVVIPMSVGVFLAAMDGTIVVSSYAAIGSELEQLQKTSWIATGYMLTLTSFQPLYGKLSDIFGRKTCLLSAYCIFALGSLLCGISQSMNALIASRALAGIGGGGMSTVVSIIMSDIVPLRSRGTWQGIINIVFATGSAIGAPLGGILADTIGWRWAFLMQVPIAVVAIISVSLALRIPLPSNGSSLKTKIRRIDFLGAFTLVVTVLLLLLGLDNGGNVSWSAPLTIGTLVGSALFSVLFALTEHTAREPLAPARIILSRALTPSYLVNFFGVAGSMCMLFHLSLYLQAVCGFSASRVGAWFIPSVVGGVSGSLIGGVVMQATGKFYWVTVAGYLLLLAGTVLVVLMSGVMASSLVGLVVGLVISSIGNGGGITTSLISLIANAGHADQAIATAVSYLFRSLGSVVGLSVGSTLVQGTLRAALKRELAGQDVDVDELVRQVRHSLDSIATLPRSLRAIVRHAYGEAIHVVFWFTVALAGVAVVAAVFIKETPLTPKVQEEGERDE
ncbi:MFS general substrate transporter [Armillaria novae-zelandiae]|uniref:MFS general substrate transporter n=1 Tax=Armillaria novae-zelandiae TaxID=153914 RepID=A0AA39U1P6_9AGAR|nr:MFS general substrate transporter [Armillaria novae-zelandiae]